LPDIEKAICDVFGLEPKSLQSDRKARYVSQPRMLAMWLARKYTRAALSEIGHYFGRRSHTTVISAQKKVDKLISKKSTIQLDHTDCHIEDALKRVETHLRTG
jgi:chromosomal replication initiator protein